MKNDVISVNFTLKYTKVHSVSHLGIKYPEEINFIKYKLQEDGTWKIVECGEELFHCDEWGDISCGGIGDNGYYDGAFEPAE